ncbi:hypothetical protein [Myxococcus xanthus]|nr:hypothetical protein [Myxococcus xanthus]
MLSSHGRTTPPLWMTLQKSALAANRAHSEDALLPLHMPVLAD